MPLQLITKETDEKIKLGLDHLEQNKQKAMDKLKAYYKKIGFEIIPRSNHMILDLELKRPTIKDIGFEDIC